MSLRDVLGQERALRLLLNTLRTGKVPSALLFAGEPGIGKRYVAINFAKALNCLNLESDSCDICSSCTKIDSGVHPDILFLKPERGEIRIDEIRSVEEALSFKPFEGKRKVVIIDQAERMNQSASNAFLKTLEEPPKGSVIIIITSSPDSLLATIRSRCCRINFYPIPEREAEMIARKIGSGDDILTLVRLSMGRPGLISSSDILRDRMRYLGMMKTMLQGGSNQLKDREELEVFIEHAMLVLRDLAFSKLDYDSGLLNRDIKHFIKAMALKASLKDIINAFSRLVQLKKQLEFNLNVNITWNYLSAIFRNISTGGL